MLHGQVFNRFALLLSVAIVWIYCHILTVGGAYNHAAPKTQLSCCTDRAGIISGAPRIRIPYPFQWGAPTFDAGEAFAMMAASFVALVESTGPFIAVSRYSSATPLPPSVLSRGVGWQGIGILLSGLFGTASGSPVSIENAGLLALTRVGSRRVVCFHPGSHCCSYLLSPICLRWSGWLELPPVLQPQQLPDQIHPGVLCLLGLFCSSILQRIHRHSRL